MDDRSIDRVGIENTTEISEHNNFMPAIFQRLSMSNNLDDGSLSKTNKDNIESPQSVKSNELIAGSSNSFNDHALSNNSGYHFAISDVLLGHGSYGDVFLANDETGKQVAVKCCDIDDTGIPNILEASIM